MLTRKVPSSPRWNALSSLFRYPSSSSSVLTIGASAYHERAEADPADTYLYVADRTGELVMETKASERRWAYAGAVLHWLYFTPFRAQPTLWAQTIT